MERWCRNLISFAVYKPSHFPVGLFRLRLTLLSLYSSSCVFFFLYLFLLNNRKWEFRRCLRCFFFCVFFPLTNQIWSPASILKMLSAFASLHFAAIIFNIPIITQCYPHSQWLSLHAFQQISKNFPWSPASKTAALCHIHMEIASTETYTPTHSYCQQTVN